MNSESECRNIVVQSMANISDVTDIIVLLQIAITIPIMMFTIHVHFSLQNIIIKGLRTRVV